MATRVSDEQYSKIMAKCSGLGCSVYDYLDACSITDKENRKPNDDFERLVQTIESISNGK
jgi:hypothetical protein